MEVLENQSFTFTWKIENFSMAPQQIHEKIESPPFVVDFLEKTKWLLQIYPREGCDRDQISLNLKRTTHGDCTETIIIGFTLAILSVDTEESIKFRMEVSTFDNDRTSGFPEFTTRKIIFDPANGLLPNDILTIECFLWEIETETKSIAPSNASLLKPYENFSRNKSSVRTRIKVGSNYVLWPIKQFSAFHGREIRSKFVPQSMPNGPSFELTFCLDEDSNSDKIIRIQVRKVIAPAVFVKGKVKILGAPKKIRHETEGEYYFPCNGNSSLIFPEFIKTKELKKYLFYTDDVLYLYFEFAFSVARDMDSFEDTDFITSVYHSESERFELPQEDRVQLYKDGKFADVILRVGTRIFKVHKCILSSRSSVFNTMFETDMKEKESGIVDIIDFDAQTIDRLLTFVYTNLLEDLTLDDASKLYSAAHKYNIECLKCRCCCVLMSTLSVSTICEVLTLAVTYDDEDLLKAIYCFIEENTNATFHSESWRDFMESNAQLAKDIMLDILTKKFLH